MANRWWGPRSDFPWEEDALRYIRDKMPGAEPYRGFQTFTFNAKSGHIREIDLFVAVPRGLFLIEIKSQPGRAVNDGNTWMFPDRRVRPLESPLHLLDLKCKELKGQLRWARDKLGLRLRIPFIAPAVFLSAPDLRCEFDDVQKVKVYGRDEITRQSRLPGIWTDLLARPPHADFGPLDPGLSGELHRLLTKIGVGGLRKHRRVGPFELEPKSFDAGPTWEDYLAKNTALPADQPRRIRIYLSELGDEKAKRESIQRAARREYLALQGISHEGIVRAEQINDEHEAGPAVIFRHGADWQRLDHFMAEHGDQLPVETRVEMVRQLAEALDHAHRRHLYHRALAARSVYVELDGRYPRLRVCDWQVAARSGRDTSGNPSPLGSRTLTGTPGGAGATSLSAHIEGSAGAYLAPEFGNAEADGTQLDVFGLGALAHLVLTGRPPAAGRKELAGRLGAQRSLVPSAVSDDISPSMDDVVRGATAVQPVDRYESVRDFLDDLEKVEEEITAPPDDDVPDLLAVTKGTVVGGWQITKVLGRGSTAKALLASKDGHEQVLKVALNEAGRDRLVHEAAELRDIRYAHIARLIEGPTEVGPRWVLVLERAGQQTLAHYLRKEGRLSIDELESLGDQLIRTADYLETQGIWHRDIKPDNLAIKEVPKKSRQLVLFDFSLAGTAERVTDAGTRHYLDPFLGTDRRPTYDAAAERYAVAVTLHEMASTELPSWGDGVVEARLLPADEVLPQLAEDGFDPALRDRLVGFFQTALHRDPARRHPSLQEMRSAWTAVFRDLDATPPATTARTVGERPADAAEARQLSAASVTAGTALRAAGLSVRAQSIAEQQLDVSTVGELVKVPAARIQRLRGVGLGPRNELVKRAREWRQQLQVAERTAEAAKLEAADTEATEAAVLSLDEVAEQLVPKKPGSAEVRVVRAVLALPDPDARPGVPGSGAAAWASQSAVAERLGLSAGYISALLGTARKRWARSVKAVTALRETVLEILAGHGRVMEAGQLAAALLAVRGSGLNDPGARIALAGSCLRAAVETEGQLDNPRLVARRHGGRVLIAAVAEDDPAAPAETELLDYAVALGRRADELVDLADAAPLPGVDAVRGALRAVDCPPGMPPLSDTDLISLAGGASRGAAVTARLELYPRDLDPVKALRQAQMGGYLGYPGIEARRVVDRVRARFPELTHPPTPERISTLLREIGYDVRVTRGGSDGDRYYLPGITQTGSWTLRSGGSGGTASGDGSPGAEARRRLDAAIERGGFLAVKTYLPDAAIVCTELAGLPRVVPVHVTDIFLAALREIVAERGRPRWETVLAADSADAAPNARGGFGRLVDEAWRRLDERVRSVDGIALLHDATALARYAGGAELVSRLATAARQADETPYGLWLLCPMDDPRMPARLDAQLVGALGDGEQLSLPRDFIDDTTRRAS